VPGSALIMRATLIRGSLSNNQFDAG